MTGPFRRCPGPAVTTCCAVCGALTLTWPTATGSAMENNTNMEDVYGLDIPRTLEGLRFAGDWLITDVETFCGLLSQRRHP